LSAVFFLRQHRRVALLGDSDEAFDAGFDVDLFSPATLQRIEK
jgi:hypothetical protein